MTVETPAGFADLQASAAKAIDDAMVKVMHALAAAANDAAWRMNDWAEFMLAAYGVNPRARARWKKLHRRIKADEQWRPRPLIHNGRKPRT